VSPPAWRQPVRIADAVVGAFQRLGLESRFRQSAIWSVWPRVVGAQIARHAQPRAMSRGRLIVHVTDPVWLHHLSMMRHRVIAALNDMMGPVAVRELVLRVGELPAVPPNPQNPPPVVEAPLGDPVSLARIETLLAPLGDVPFRDALYRLLLRAHRAGDLGPSRQKSHSPLQS
jgi:hypothetical protein